MIILSSTYFYNLRILKEALIWDVGLGGAGEKYSGKIVSYN